MSGLELRCGARLGRCGMPDQPETLVGQYWPRHGPYSPARAEAATSTVSELVRYLNYATGQGSRQALRDAGDVYAVVGGLKAAAGGLEQTLRQLGARTVALRDDPTLGHCRRRGDRAAARTEAAGESLAAARQAVVALYDALDAAQAHLASLYHREESDDDGF